MDIIISRDNKLFKKLIKLNEKKHRKEIGEFISEGERWIKDALKVGKADGIINVILSEDKLGEVSQLITDYPFLEGKVSVFKRELFNKASATESPCGIMIIHSVFTPKTELPKGEFCLYLDRIRDPGNLGMILRSAAACGFSDIVLNDCADVYSPKTVRSCMTGMFYLNIFNDISINTINELGYKILAADMGGNNIFSRKTKKEKICLVIGNEASGISEDILKSASEIVSLPMLNIESLNAGAAATTLMYLLANK